MKSEPRSAKVLHVSEERWTEAQANEKALWEHINIGRARRPAILRVIARYLRALRNPALLRSYLANRDFSPGDDWNHWWLKQFDGYHWLPARIECAVESGCGPYTNIRLIAATRSVREIHCVDPLMDSYLTYPGTWLTRSVRRGKVFAHKAKGESLPLADGRCDLAVCINVLDHVQDAEQCMRELWRVLRPGGYVVFGQDLTNEEDVSRPGAEVEEVYHPIRLDEEAVAGFFDRHFDAKLRKVLSRNQGREPLNHYGTFVFIGQKRSV